MANFPPAKIEKPQDLDHLPAGYRFLYFSELLKTPVCAGKIRDRIGKLTDLVFAVSETYPEAVGLYIEKGWGKPTLFIPWKKVLRIEEDAIFVCPPDNEDSYPPFVDQPGWILLDRHLMGRTILDMDGRRSEVVNDIHLIESRGRLLLVHVDVSLRGVFRRLGLGRFKWSEDRLVSWKYVQPFSVEDAITTDKVTLSITRKQMLEMPSEDLADVLEELSGKEQEALFSALDSEKAAEALSEAEPRAQRQIIANIRAEKARNILSEMTIPQLVGLFSVLPHADVTNLMAMLSDEQAVRVREILSRREIKAVDLLSSDFWIFPGTATVAEVLTKIRHADKEQDARSVSYIYVVDADSNKLLGVVDLREIILARDAETLEHIMAFPVVTAEVDDAQEDLAELFAKYHYRTIPVVDPEDHILGVIYYNDIMKGIETRLKV